MSAAKIGSKCLAARAINVIKHELEFELNKSGHQRQGALPLTMGNYSSNMELCALRSQWPSRPTRSYHHQAKLKHNVDIVFGTASNSFAKNEAHKGTFLSQKYMFSKWS